MPLKWNTTNLALASRKLYFDTTFFTTAISVTLFDRTVTEALHQAMICHGLERVQATRAGKETHGFDALRKSEEIDVV